MPLPHVLKRIRLELARSKEFPAGSANHGYEFVAPLDGKGHIDPHLWQKYRQHCGVRRFWNGADEEIGRLTHKPGGAEHARPRENSGGPDCGKVTVFKKIKDFDWLPRRVPR